MENINNVFDRRVDIVCDNYSSVFTKEDVLNMLSGLRAEVLKEADTLTNGNSISETTFQEFSCNVASALECSLDNGSIDPIDHDSAEFAFEYNSRVVLENINVDARVIAEALSEILFEQFQESFGEFTTPKVE